MYALGTLKKYTRLYRLAQFQILEKNPAKFLIVQSNLNPETKILSFIIKYLAK